MRDRAWVLDAAESEIDNTVHQEAIMKATRQASLRGARGMISAAIGALGFGLFATVSQAAAVPPGEQVAQHVVRYGDLNLTSRAGVDQLYQRIVSAARGVCGTDQAFSLTAQVESRDCAERAIARAVATVDNPGLSNRYRDSAGHGVAASARPVAP
jgi:UrcA family protein